MRKRVRAIVEFNVADLPRSERADLAAMGNVPASDLPRLTNYTAVECADVIIETELDYGGSDFYAEIYERKIISAEFVES